MKYLSDYMNEKQTALFNRTNSFFAFGDKQFQEQRKEGVKYASLGNGLICPVEYADELQSGLKTIYFDAIVLRLFLIMVLLGKKLEKYLNRNGL